MHARRLERRARNRFAQSLRREHYYATLATPRWFNAALGILGKALLLYFVFISSGSTSTSFAIIQYSVDRRQTSSQNRVRGGCYELRDKFKKSKLSFLKNYKPLIKYDNIYTLVLILHWKSTVILKNFKVSASWYRRRFQQFLCIRERKLTALRSPVVFLTLFVYKFIQRFLPFCSGVNFPSIF